MGEKPNISRRSFISGAAGVLALGTVPALASCAPTDSRNSQQGSASAAGIASKGLPSSWDFSADIVVVGGGGGGAVSATKAAELGAQVILLEKANILGGDTLMSSQAAQGFWSSHVDAGDSIDQYMEDLKNSHWATEKGQAGIELPSEFPLTTAWLEACDEMYDWTENLGMEWVDVTTKHEAWYPQPQWDTKETRQWAPSGGSIMNVMEKAANAAGVETMLSTPAQELIVDDSGRVVGLWALDAKENTIAVEAKKAVILACGGFNANRGMMSRYLPEQGQGYCGGCNGNTGDGHTMVKAIGGQLTDMDLGTHWMVYDDAANTTMYNGGSMSYGGNKEYAEAADYPFLLINYKGERFMSETMGYKWVGYHTNNQAWHMNHIVFDSGDTCQTWLETAAATYGGLDSVKMYEADTLEQLAVFMQVPADALSESISRYNGFVDAGVDEDFDRSMRKVVKLDTPPFRAIRMRPRHYTTYGGIAIDPQAHVLDQAGNVIPGLYAAGTCCGSILEQEGLYYQGGVGQTMTFGYIAATQAASE